jgi:lysophospholipase L1-like esterase
MFHRPGPSPWLIALLGALVVGGLVGLIVAGFPDRAVSRPPASATDAPARPVATQVASPPATTPSAAVQSPTAAADTAGTPPVALAATATPAVTPAAASSAVPVATPGTATPAPASAVTGSAGAPAPATPTPGVARPFPPNPLISRGKPVFASPDVADAAGLVDGHYCGRPAWRTATFPTWVAIRVGAGPSALLLSWNSDPINYVDPDGAPQAGVPAAYTIQTSADSTTGGDGTWQTIARVDGNVARTRAHRVPFAGAAWVRLTVNGVTPVAGDRTLLIDEIDIHDASRGTADTVFFMGDSITASAFLRCDPLQPSFARLMHEAVPDYFPAQINGGVAGISSDWGMERIDRWLAEAPDYKVWAIAYGTNDAYRERPSPVFERQIQTLIDRAREAGREPVLARIPYTDNAQKDEHVRRLNGVIDGLTARNGLRRGPDLYTWFRDHPHELARDGIHPTTAGCLSINRLWYEALRPRYESGSGIERTPAPRGTSTVTGR